MSLDSRESRPAKSAAAPVKQSEIAPIDRRTQILRAAAKLFAEFGYEATSVRQIADAVDIQAGSLYHHFVGKEEMLHEIVRDPMRNLVQRHTAISILPADAEHQMIAGVIMRFEEYIEHWEVHAIVQRDGTFFRRNKEFSYVEEGRQHAFGVQEKIMKDGMATGLFHAGIDTTLMIGTIARMLSSSVTWFRRGDVYGAPKPHGYTLDALIDFHLDSILRMLREPSRLTDPIPRAAAEAMLRAG